MTESSWTLRLRHTLESYDDKLLRKVASKLCKPRNHWATEELLERSLAALDNAAVLDRRLKDESPCARLILSLIAHSRQPRWSVGSLIQMAATLGHDDAVAEIMRLLESGLLYPELFGRAESAATAPLPTRSRLKSFETWLAQARPPEVFAHSTVIARSRGFDSSRLEVPKTLRFEKPPLVLEADGLEWPLRLAALWQQLAGAPMRRTQQGDFFKRDLDRLVGDPLLSQNPADALADVPDSALFTVELGLALGLLCERDGELRVGSFPEAWNSGLPGAIASLWTALLQLEAWDAAKGWHVAEAPGCPHASTYLLALLLLGEMSEGDFACPETIERWIVQRHPFWITPGATATRQELPVGTQPKSSVETTHGIARFLLGVAYPLRLVQAARDADGNWAVRLSPMGRWLLGLGDLPASAPAFPQTVLVQPNLEILAYRQGLTPELILRLGKFATWKSLGAACTLQLEPQSVYRALEAGETFGSIVQTLEQHGMKDLPPAVLDSLRTWSNKRDRISIYAAAALFEFPGPAELNEALARGLAAVRLTDRLAVASSEESIDYRHFRLTGTRDYCLPPEKCVDVEADGVTLSVDLARSDLLLETEILAFAEPNSHTALPGRRLYSLTPASLKTARGNGLSQSDLETWFAQRAGVPISPAAGILLTGPERPPMELRRQLVLHVASADVADGLQQWPGTRALIQARLGPTTLVVAEGDVDMIRARCQELGLTMEFVTH